MYTKQKYKFIPYNRSLIELARVNRNNPTPAEKKIWFEILQNKDLENYKFIRQKVVGNYIIDFYFSKLLLAIEIDGDTHGEKVEYDNQRSEKLKELGIDVIRYYNIDIMSNIEGIYDDLKERIKRREREIL